MEAAAGTTETVPLLLKVPIILSSEEVLCFSEYNNYFLLGYGDVMIPGFLVCFAYSFDTVRGVKGKPYFIATFVGR